MTDLLIDANTVDRVRDQLQDALHDTQRLSEDNRTLWSDIVSLQGDIQYLMRVCDAPREIKANGRQ